MFSSCKSLAIFQKTDGLYTVIGELYAWLHSNFGH